jgi:superfamily II DNA/RNA helicase
MPAELSAAPETDATTETDVTFASLGVPAALVEVLAGDGIINPFPVQAATLPDALAGRDILGRAQTGSGKTLGFSLPMVTRLAGGQTAPGRPRGLVLVPTRELATQVYEVLRPLARAMGLWVTTIYGGVSYGPQVTALRRRTDIAVATPGRLADLINQGECDLSDVEIMVIDEADQMADLGFLPIVRRLLEATPADGQRMLFSATLDAAIDVLVRRFLNNPATHSVNENSSPAEIEHHVITIDPAKKLEVLATLTGGDKRSLVFTRTKHGAERLARQLTELGIPAAELHGNLRQGARARNLAAFSSGVARVMVATDIAARGIHVDGIDLVIHADPPAEHKAYVHRSGRTARGGADGVVVTLQMRSQAREVTAMMRRAGIAPHTAFAADPEADVLREIAGPPAPRVSVSGKVSELVRPEDRLPGNGSGGPGGPGGRGGYGRGGAGRSRDDRPRRDRKPGGSRYSSERSGGYSSDRSGSADRRDFTPRSRDERPAVGDRVQDDRPARFDRDDRPAQFNRDGQSDRAQRPERSDRTWDGGPSRPADGQRFDRDRNDRSFSDSRAPRDNSFQRDDRPATGDRPYRQDRDSRDGQGAAPAGRGDRQFSQDRPQFRGNRDYRDSGNGGTARPERGDWYPRENRPYRGSAPAGGAPTGGDRRPGASGGWPSGDSNGRTGTGNRSFSGYRTGDSRDGSGRAGRPPAAGRPGSARDRSGYSAGRGGTFKARDH